MELLSGIDFPTFFASYGYVALACIVALESMGLPVPGESSLVAAALIAGTSGRLEIGWVITAASVGAIVGDNIGYVLGRGIGSRLLLNYGRYVRLSDERIKIGKYLFARYGGAVVFFGRFVAVLRAVSAFLAGATGMRWPEFLIYNAAGGVVWSALYGMSAYYFGRKIIDAAAPAAVGIGLLAFGCILAGIFLMRKHEHELSARAEQAFPGPLRPPKR
jgi:membrane protein DedA with SNARE-associated domain